MSKQALAFPLRMPEELRAWFDAAAKENGRSLNSELVQCLNEVKEVRAKRAAAELRQPGRLSSSKLKP